MKTRRKFLKHSSYLAAGSMVLPLGCTSKKPETAQTITEEVVESLPKDKEMGVQIYSVRDALKEDFVRDFELLKSKSLLWGSPEWLEMRKRTAELKGFKGTTTKRQRKLYRFLRGSGLKWYF